VKGGASEFLLIQYDIKQTEQTSSKCSIIKAIKALRYAGCEGREIIGNIGRILFYFWPMTIYTQAADASGNAHRPSHKVFVIRRTLRNKKIYIGGDHDRPSARPYAPDLASVTKNRLSVFMKFPKNEFS
jgi:hypothetical protein